jgi:hypothetical protein
LLPTRQPQQPHLQPQGAEGLPWATRDSLTVADVPASTVMESIEDKEQDTKGAGVGPTCGLRPLLQHGSHS